MLRGFNSSPVLTGFLEKNLHTDVIFDLGTVKIPAHKLILSAASDYFNTLFFTPGFRALGVTVPVNGISPEIFKMYLEYVYGNSIRLTDLRTAFQLFMFIDYSQTHWETKDQDLSNLNISSDYIDYIHLLIRLYHEEVPLEVLQKSAKFIKEYVDLSGLDPEVIKTITNSTYFDPKIIDRQKIYQNLISKGYDYGKIVGLEERLTPDLKTAIQRRQPITVQIVGATNGYTIEARGTARDMPPEVLSIRSRNLDPKFAEKILLAFDVQPINLQKNDVITITNYESGYGSSISYGLSIRVKQYSKI